jgi:hypothetical protein
MAILKAILIMTGSAMAFSDTLHGEAGGMLTVDLSQWKYINFKLGNRTHVISVEDAFDALVKP